MAAALAGPTQGDALTIRCRPYGADRASKAPSDLYGRDAHHMAEAVFKGLAKAVDAACQLDPRVEGVPSTKGSL